MRKQYKSIKISVEVYNKLNRLKLDLSVPGHFKSFDDAILYLFEKSGELEKYSEREEKPD